MADQSGSTARPCCGCAARYPAHAVNCAALQTQPELVSKPDPAARDASVLDLAAARRFLRWVCVLALAIPGVGLGKTVVRHYGPNDGMPVGSALALEVDGDGFLWLATHDGLARFDGRRFKTYDTAGTPDLGSNRIVGLFRGVAGQLYALGSDGEWLQVSTPSIDRIRLDGEQSAVRHVWRGANELCITLSRALYCDRGAGFVVHTRFTPGQEVFAAVPDGEDAWLAVSGVGIVRVDHGTAALVLDLPALGRYSRQAIAALGSSGQFWIDLEEGLIELRRDSSQRWIARDPQRAVFVVQLRVEAGDQLYVGTDAGLYRTRDQEVEWLHQGTPGTTSSRSWRGPDGSLWAAQVGVLQRDGETVLRSRGEIRALTFDRDIVWVGTDRDGIYALSQARVDAPIDALLSSSNVYGLWAGQSSEVWAGSLGEGLFRIDGDDRTHRYGPAQGLPGLFTWVVAVSPEQEVFAASLTPGLWQLDRGDDRFVRSNTPDPLRLSSLLSISFDQQSRLWVSASDGVWLRDADGWRKRWPDAGSETVKTVLHAQDGAVWLGGEQGLVRVDDRIETRIAGTVIGNVAVRAVQQGRDGRVWAATEGNGLITLAPGDITGATARRLGRMEGLPSNSPHALVEDANGNLWINSNQGIFRLTPAEIRSFVTGATQRLSPLVLGLSDGLEELEGNGGVQPAAGIDGEGRIWFPSQRGVVRFNPATLSSTRPAPKPIIEEFSAGGDPLGGTQSVQPVLGMREVELRYNAADLYGGAVRYRYRLLPNQGEWTDAGTRDVAAFAALSPGDYRFEVQAGNSDGNWSLQPAVTSFTIAAFWYETKTARLAAAVLAVLLGILFAQLRVHRLRARTRLLDQVVQTRTAELSTEKSRAERALSALAQAHDELSESHQGIVSRNQRLAEQASRLEALDSFRTRLLADVSHELRTPLMLIRLPLEQWLSRGAQALESDRRLVELAHDHTGRLGKLVEQLVSLVQAEAQQLVLRATRLDMEKLLARIVEGFAAAAQQNQVKIALNCEQLPPIYGDVMHLSTVVSNLLDNACKYAPQGSTIELRAVLSTTGDSVRVSVQDQGPGFAAEVAGHLFERFFRGDGPPRAGREGLGIGLALAHDLVLLHGGRIGAECTPGAGTCFCFELPLGSAHIALEELAIDDAEALPILAAQRQTPCATQPLLLVEDHPELAAYLHGRLSEHFPVLLAHSAEQAWTALQEHSIDVVVSDVVLPGMSGIELCREIKADAALAKAMVILISAKAGDADRAAGIAAGAQDWLAKPFAFDALLASIGRARSPTTASEDALANDPLLRIARERLPDAEFGLNQWAESVHLSERQLRRRVTELTGVSPVSWLREQRLLRVRELIRDGRCKTLAQAGAQSGFENASYLYRLYGARFGAGLHHQDRAQAS
jgi:signal transduction histidine kinase/ligand-binding sensor domain-containing protein/DNA-binding response OmpR family regulator